MLPPGSVAIVASASFSIAPTEVENLDSSDIRLLALAVFNWANERALAAGDESTGVVAVMIEGLNVTVVTRTRPYPSIALVEAATRRTVCTDTSRCDVMSINWSGVEPARERQLSEAGSLLAASPPMEVEAQAILMLSRARDVQAVIADTIVGSSQTTRTIADSLAGTESALSALNISLVGAVATSLTAEVRLFHMVENSSMAEDTAMLFYEKLLNTSGLMIDFGSVLPIDAVSIDVLQVEYDHEIAGYVVINSTNYVNPALLSFGLVSEMLNAPSTVQTMSVTISTVIATTLAASAAASVAASVAASTAGAAGGGSGAGAAGGGSGGPSAAVSGVTPLLFGAQRFASSSGLAADVSVVQAEVANSMSWATGDLGISFGSSSRGPSETEPIADSESPPVRTPLQRLVSVVTVMLSVLISFLLIHAYLIHRWRHRVNKVFYEARRNPMYLLHHHSKGSQRSHSSSRHGSKLSERTSQSHAERSTSTSGRPSSSRVTQGQSFLSSQTSRAPRRSLAAEMSRVRFTPFPMPLVFPGLPLLIVQIFCTGMAFNAVRNVVDVENCDVGCRAFAGIVIAFLIVYEVVTIGLVVNFHIHYRALCWNKSTHPSEVNKVVDPLYRLVSWIRVRILPKRYPARIIDRAKGAFKKPKAWNKEPARTERLLAAPRTFVHPNPADMLDGIGFALMARSGGSSLGAAMFEMVALGGNLAVAALNGAGGVLVPGSNAATAQIIAVLCVQLTVSLYVAILSPSADRVMNILIGSQFALEASGTGIILARTLRPELITADAQAVAFIVALLAMIAPVLQRFYDAIIVQLSKVMRKDGFTWKGFIFSMVGLIVYLPTMVIRLSSCDCSSDMAMSATEMAGDDINKLATKMANEGLVQHIEEGIAEIASRAFWQAHVDAEFRRGEAEEIVEAAARALQARFRARRAARRRLQKIRVAAAMVARPKTGSERPGFDWLEEKMAKVYGEEFEQELDELRKSTYSARKQSFVQSMPLGLPPISRHSSIGDEFEPKVIESRKSAHAARKQSLKRLLPTGQPPREPQRALPLVAIHSIGAECSAPPRRQPSLRSAPKATPLPTGSPSVVTTHSIGAECSAPRRRQPSLTSAPKATPLPTGAEHSMPSRKSTRQPTPTVAPLAAPLSSDTASTATCNAAMSTTSTAATTSAAPAAAAAAAAAPAASLASSRSTSCRELQGEHREREEQRLLAEYLSRAKET